MAGELILLSADQLASYASSSNAFGAFTTITLNGVSPLGGPDSRFFLERTQGDGDEILNGHRFSIFPAVDDGMGGLEPDRSSPVVEGLNATPDGFGDLAAGNSYIVFGLFGGDRYVVSLGGFDGGGFAFTNDPSSTDAVVDASGEQLDISEVEAAAVCFAPGTLIATPTGERAVETLRRGDRVLTADGRAVPVRWMGRQTRDARGRSLDFAPGRVAPVTIRAGALAEGQPHSDLTVTADHGMVLDGLVVHAGALVNGTSIVRVPLTGKGGVATFWHIETEGHEVVLANGAPAETFVDAVDRRAFDNYAEFEALFGADTEATPELDMPRVQSARSLPGALRVRLAARAEALAPELALSA